VLDIAGVTDLDEGTYECRARNKLVSSALQYISNNAIIT